MVSEFAVWADAMRARPDRRFSAFERSLSRHYDGFPAGHETLRIRSDIIVEEADGGISRIEAKRALDVADDDSGETNAVAVQDPGLSRDITNLVGFDPAAVLDFNQPPAAPMIRFEEKIEREDGDRQVSQLGVT